MTSTYEHSPRVRHIGAEREAADAMTGPAHDAALLHNDVLQYERDCVRVRESGLSEKCSQIDVVVNGTANPNRPFVLGECCDTHRELRTRRNDLTTRAAALGVELNFDFTQVIED